MMSRSRLAAGFPAGRLSAVAALSLFGGGAVSPASAGLCPAEGDCCEANGSAGCDDFSCCDLVCSQDLSCCEAIWDAGCVKLAGILCDQCEPQPSDCPGEGGACCSTSGNGTPGCERTGCCETVCDLDGFCCRVEWDNVCSRMARENCDNVCDCVRFGDFDDDGAIDLRDFASLQNCFTGEGGQTSSTDCACGDFEGDGDIDALDVRVFVSEFLR